MISTHAPHHAAPHTPLGDSWRGAGDRPRVAGPYGIHTCHQILPPPPPREKHEGSPRRGGEPMAGKSWSPPEGPRPRPKSSQKTAGWGEIPAWVRTTCPKNMHGQHLCTVLRSQRKIPHIGSLRFRKGCHKKKKKGKKNERRKKKIIKRYSQTKAIWPHASYGVREACSKHLALFAKQWACKKGKGKKWRHAT